jgi:flagellar biosynthetic protein FliQ
MTTDFAVQIVRETLTATLWISAPLLILGFIIGIAVSLIQIVTSIQDSAFSAVPRLAAFLAGLILFLPWMLSRLMSFTAAILGDVGRFAR